MSKIVYICYRKADFALSLKREIEQIADRITPDNITPALPKARKHNGIIYGVVNPVDLVLEQNASVLHRGCMS